MNKIILTMDLWYTNDKAGDILEVVKLNRNGTCFAISKNGSTIFIDKKEFKLLDEEGL